jgi:hypothetical protein
MTSHDKVRAMLAQLQTIEAPPGEAGLQAVLLAIEFVGPQIEAMIPPDPAELDELLLTGAHWALGLRSDDAPPFALEPGPAVPVIAEPGAISVVVGGAAAGDASPAPVAS